MSIFIAVALYVFSLYVLIMGISSLKDSEKHQDYGVESKSLHKKFSVFLIFLSALAALVATLILL